MNICLRRILLLSVCLFVFPLFAQEEPVLQEVALPQEATPADESPRRELQVLTGPRVAVNTVTDGTAGEVILTATVSPHTNAGVLLRSASGTPSIAAVLGSSAAGGNFSVFNSGNTSLFRVDGLGAVGIGTASPGSDLHLFRGDALTTMRIEHTAAGSGSGTRGGRVEFFENGTLKASLMSNGSGSTSPLSGANGLQLVNHANGNLVLATNNTERMRIQAAGNVGIGTTSPSMKLQVFANTAGTTALGANTQTLIEANVAQSEIGANINSIQAINAGVTNDAGVTGVRTGGFLYGAGTMEDSYGLFVRTGVYTGHTGKVIKATAIRAQVIAGSGSVDLGYGVNIPDVQATTGYAIYQEAANDINHFAGKVRVGGSSTRPEILVVTGDAHFNGTVTGTNIKAQYQDLAEWVPSGDDLAPGTLVVLHPERPNEVMSSGRAYDTTVAGVVSAEPGIILGVEGAGKEQIATTGRVKVRVDARNAPIRIGDLLVTSDVPGTAMRSEAIEIGGHAFHRPGTIVGKALEQLDGGIGEILVLLSLQ